MYIRRKVFSKIGEKTFSTTEFQTQKEFAAKKEEESKKEKVAKAATIGGATVGLGAGAAGHAAHVLRAEPRHVPWQQDLQGPVFLLPAGHLPALPGAHDAAGQTAERPQHDEPHRHGAAVPGARHLRKHVPVRGLPGQQKDGKGGTGRLPGSWLFRGAAAQLDTFPVPGALFRVLPDQQLPAHGRRLFRLYPVQLPGLAVRQPVRRLQEL